MRNEAVVRPVAVYARISADRSGEGLGVARQVEDCMRLVAERGWVVFDTYVDNDISAFTGGRERPEFSRMIADIEAGRVGAVVVYHQDRLTRRPGEFERFVEVCQRHGVDQLVTVTSDISFGNDNGMLVARITAAVAANESARKRARILRKVEQNVAAGKPNGGAARPFGYEDDKVTVRETEAQIIRTVADRFIQGEPLRSLVAWLNEEGIPTSGRADTWRTTTLRTLLMAGRIAGLRDHHGEVAGEAAWDPIISREVRERILAVFASRKRAGRRAPQRYLLSGLLRCGKCEGRLFSAARKTPAGGVERRYVCQSGPDHGGCGKLTVSAVPVESWITEAALYRLDTPEVAVALEGRGVTDARHADAVAALGAAQRRLTDVAEMFAAGDISKAEYLAARPIAEAKAAEAGRVLESLATRDTLDSLVGQGTLIRDRWDTYSLDRQHAIVRAILPSATIAPGTRGRGNFDPDRVQPHWAA
ncbi:recombinase family protein [Microbacterium sp. A8/3-1]|uniref:Recombinase family protein n=1 Tax=Microbacterium sp. A8/3-1 TaxID=3160749 RepID=A0AAU7W038_9MICO